MTKLVILDRDGVINKDSPNYIKTVEEWEPIPGSIEAIVKLKQKGFKVAIATNQSGIARGLLTEEILAAQHTKMQEILSQQGGQVDYIAYCPHHPDDNCACRKPKPGLLHQIAQHFNVSLKGVPVLGDSLRDLQSACSVDAQPILVKTGKGEKTMKQDLSEINPKIYSNLFEAVKKLVGN